MKKEEIANSSFIKKIISIGQKKGNLSYEDILSFIPEKFNTSDNIGEIVKILINNNIKVQEFIQDDFGKPIIELDKEPKKVYIEEPAKLYMREIGKLSTLDITGEQRLAKQIEANMKSVTLQLMASFIFYKEVENSIKNINGGYHSFEDFINFIENGKELDNDEKQKYFDKFLKLFYQAIDKIRNTGIKYINKITSTKLEKIKSEYENIKIQYAEKIYNFNINTGEIEKILAKYETVVNEIMEMQTKLKKFEEKYNEHFEVIVKNSNALNKKDFFSSIKQKYEITKDEFEKDIIIVRDLVKSISNYEKMYLEKSEDLVKKYKKMKENLKIIKEAEDKLVRGNLRLVVLIAKQYLGRGVNFFDLIQEGNIGLMKAVDKFEYQKGFRFASYASWWIRQAMLKVIAEQARSIRIPAHILNQMTRITREIRYSLIKTGKRPSVENLSLKLDIPVKKVRSIMDLLQDVVSLEAPVGDEQDSTVSDFICDNEKSSPDHIASNNMLQEELDVALETLSGKERKILRMRFGLDDGYTYTLEEVGYVFNVTRERIRQIEAQALKKLRHFRHCKKLKDYLRL